MSDMWHEAVDDDWVSVRLARMERLGASVQELAMETIESIMGHDGKGGHKPARPDIQKMKDAHDLFHRAFTPHGPRSEIAETDEEFDDAATAREEWGKRYGLDEKEISAVSLYRHVLTNRSGDFYNDPQKAFDFVARLWSGVLDVQGVNPEAVEQSNFDPERYPITPEGKKFVGNALKKYEQQNWPMLYTAIKNGLDDVYRRGQESYKLWPRMVSWIKEYYQDWSMQNQTFNRPNQSWSPISGAITHIEDITSEGGKILDELRRENRLPQGFDVNKVNFKGFEEWLMDWKRENLGSEHAGEVVYEFKDKWTIQKLTTPEQLQFEGDEMGHCVGGYAQSVGSGEDIIYSLRDPKGHPHVTMEIAALQGAPSYGFTSGAEDPPEDAIYNHEYIHPDKHDPGEHLEDKWHQHSNLTSYVPTGETPFQVVQVQGNQNTTPKPEYQRKIREFLDYLRSKGWKFERSGSWFAPFDDPAQDQYGEGAPNTAKGLDEWYDDHYKTHHEVYRGIGDGDAYGLPAERAKVGVGDWEALFKDCVTSLLDDYDRGRWQGNWKDLAQAVYHAWIVDGDGESKSPEQLEHYKKMLLDEIQRVEETLSDWSSQYHWDTMDNNPEPALDKLDDLLEEAGLAEQFEHDVDNLLVEEYGDSSTLPAGLRQQVQQQVAQGEKYEEYWTEAQDGVREGIEDSIYGDAYRFCQYLYMLAEKKGLVNPQELPDPNERHGGLPSFEDLEAMPWSSELTQQTQAPVEQGLPGALSAWQPGAHPVEIHPIDHDHNVWFDTDGNQRERYRPGWAENPTTGRMEQTGELQDTFLDKHGRQGYGWVAYNDDVPVGSLTAVDDSGWHMIGTTYVHPNFREQGIFTQLAQPLRETGRPIDAYVWENPWLKNKVRSWRT